jgi:FtsZ-binding cell division protein ZapB
MPTELLDELEARVREAAERIRALKEQNARLSERVGELEEQLTAGEAAGERAGWEQERDEVRRRLQHLTHTLAGLLEE